MNVHTMEGVVFKWVSWVGAYTLIVCVYAVHHGVGFFRYESSRANYDKPEIEIETVHGVVA